MNSLLRDKTQPLTRTAYLILWTLVLTTLGFWRNGTDPYNIPKLLLLAAFAGLVLGNLLVGNFKKENKVVILLVFFFMASLLVPILFSGAPLVQQVYGISGRNTGLLAYLFLAILLLGAATFPRISDYQVIPRSILLTGIGSFLVCILELLNINLIAVNNVFGVIIGTLGNPNFLSAFSAMISVGSFALLFNPMSSLSAKLIYLFLTLSSLFLVFQTKSFQGLGSIFFGVILILAFVLIYQKRWKFFFLLISLSSLAGIFLIAGVLNRGPLSGTLYQMSLPIRVQYWQAGLSMFFNKPLTGVGLNSYGDWYRYARDADSLVSPGANVTTNVAHNVYIDFASNGGIFLILSFTLLFGFTFVKTIRTLLSLKAFDPILISTFAMWIVYLLQAFFSIDQLGLAVWGWVLAGALIGMTKQALENKDIEDLVERRSELKRQKERILSNQTNSLIPQILLFWIFIGSVVPAFKSDLDWASARRTANAETITSQIRVWPQDEIRYSNGVYLFLKSNLFREAVPITLQGLDIFPRSSVLWNYLYQNPAAPIVQRNLAREKLLELDPLNPSVLALKKIPG